MLCQLMIERCTTAGKPSTGRELTAKYGYNDAGNA